MTKQIKVDPGYRGRRTNEQFIAPGVYDFDDPALFGTAQYLIDAGRAVEIGSESDGKPRQAVQRDMSGRIIATEQPEERVNTPPSLAVYDHPANRLSAEDMPPVDALAGVVAGSPTVLTTDTTVEHSTEIAPQGLDNMTVPQLRDYATAIGMSVEGLTTKEALIPAIDAYMAGYGTGDGQPVDLDAMTVDQLKDFAHEQGFDIRGLSKKGELVAAIGKQLNEADEA